jgi:hypothetical protein
MRAFTEAWPDRAIVQQLVAQLPWGHNCVLLDRVKDAKTREFDIRKTIEHPWLRFWERRSAGRETANPARGWFLQPRLHHFRRLPRQKRRRHPISHLPHLAGTAL